MNGAHDKRVDWLVALMAPLLNLSAALTLSAAVVASTGADPSAALTSLIRGAFGYPEAIGYTLYYATSFIFTGLSVSLAYRVGLFNLGAEGQATLGGLGVGVVALAMPDGPWPLVAVLAILAGGAIGALWGAVPGWLWARRGAHVVITTIMFNFIAASLMTWVMVDVLIAPGQSSPESVPFGQAAWMPSMARALGWFGVSSPNSPLNLSLIWALVCCVGVWVLVWRTRWGYALRVVGANQRAAVYAGIDPARVLVWTMALAGALAGCVGLNELLGVQHRLILNFTGGAGFVGVAVALMGRAHPLGVALTALLFGALYQGGSELSFDFPSINAEVVVVIQGLVVLFTGALERMFQSPLRRLIARLPPFRARESAGEGAT